MTVRLRISKLLRRLDKRLNPEAYVVRVNFGGPAQNHRGHVHLGEGTFNPPGVTWAVNATGELERVIPERDEGRSA